MKIRSITYFLNATYPLQSADFDAAKTVVSQAKSAVEAAGYEVQTTRLATQPFTEIEGLTPDEVVTFAQDLEAKCFVAGINYGTIGMATLDADDAYFQAIPKVIANTDTIFACAEIGDKQGNISLTAIKQVSQVIKRCAEITPDGFGNLRFCATANVPGGVPFLPGAYHAGNKPAFALALECADLVVDAFKNAESIAEAREKLQSSIEQHAVAMQNALKDVRGATFLGFDFSPAPFPEQASSIGAALESLGLPNFGMHGSLATCAMLTDTIQSAKFKKTGYCGLFLPVLEDNVLAIRGAQGALAISELLLFSAVCGTGLDTVPIAGNVSTAELQSILLDLASLAVRLNKPLTCRLMPIPNKIVGDALEFDFPFFANGGVMPHQGQTLEGVLAGDETIALTPRLTR